MLILAGVAITAITNSEGLFSQAEGADKTAHEFATQLQGNQFVWIPCSIDDYEKITWGAAYTNNDPGWDTSTNTAEKTQIQKYGGFYVA